jgi:hypothetical protein
MGEIEAGMEVMAIRDTLFEIIGDVKTIVCVIMTHIVL